MAIAALAAIGLDHRTAALNAVALAAGIALVVDPAVVYDPGLYLSFGATIALIAGVPRMAAVWPMGPSSAPPSTREDASLPGLWPRLRLAARWTTHAAAMLIGATVCVEMVLFPVATYLFSRFSIAGFVLNLAAVPLMTVVQVAGLAAALLTAVASVPLGAGVGYLAHIGATGLVESSGLVLLAPALAQRVPPPSAWVVGMYLATLGAILICRRRLERWLLAGMAAALGGVIYSGISSPVHQWFDDAAQQRVDPGSLRCKVLARTCVLRALFFDVGTRRRYADSFPEWIAMADRCGRLDVPRVRRR